MDNQLQTIYQSIQDGQHKDICAQVEKALQNGILPKSILEEGMIPAMAEVGRLFEIGEYYVPEMLIASRTMHAGLAIIEENRQKTAPLKGRMKGGQCIQMDCHSPNKYLFSVHENAPYMETIRCFGASRPQIAPPNMVNGRSFTI